jgi:uncharacterized phage protein gp47/JayE
MSTPAYLPPQIGTAGLTIPGYNSILAQLVLNYQGIYGQNVYLGNDSSDFQWISVLALMIADTLAGQQQVYNNQSPATAIGAGLDLIVAINGLTRKSASYSTCQVTLTGVAGSVINNGQVQDVNGNLWNLPTPLTIGAGGTVNAVVTAQTSGPVNALANQISNIFTPTAGWVSVTNGPNVAALGQPVETDAQLRGRQALSTELPSETLLAGTIAAVAATSGVTRYNVLENYTNVTDGFGNPPHSITAVVEGGASVAVATAIYNNRGIGVLTNGTVTVDVTDPNSGVVTAISFNLPAYVPVYVIVNAHLLNGGTASTIAAIQTALVAYLNSLQIGELVSYGALIAVAMGVNANLSNPVVSVHSLFFGTAPAPAATTDIPIFFNQVSQGLVANVAVNSV